MNDDEFFKKYEAYERESLKETIAYLIEHRQKLRDEELKRLESEAENLLMKIEKIEKEKTIEEVRCFREILSLQRRLLENDK